MDGEQIVIDITNRLWINRYLYVFVKFLNISGYKVYLLCSKKSIIDKYIKFWSYFDTYGKLLLNPKLCFFIFDILSIPNNYIYMYFEGEDKNISVNWKDKTILDLNLPPSDKHEKKINKQISFYYYNAVNSDFHAYLPFFMHPNIYLFGQHEKLKEYRKNKRSMSILFVGNVAYDNAINKNDHGILSRYQIIKHIISQSSRLNVITPKVNNDLQHLSINTLVLILRKHLSIKQRYWLNFLSNSNFFLCAGTIINPLKNNTQPRIKLCHNIVEAMAVGTIPLTNYADAFYPPLEDGETCLSFNNLNEMEQQINRIYQMDEQTTSMMRKNVIAYYEKYLEPCRYIERMFRHLNI